MDKPNSQNAARENFSKIPWGCTRWHRFWHRILYFELNPWFQTGFSSKILCTATNTSPSSVMGCLQTLYFLKTARIVESESLNDKSIKIVYRKISTQTWGIKTRFRASPGVHQPNIILWWNSIRVSCTDLQLVCWNTGIIRAHRAH